MLYFLMFKNGQAREEKTNHDNCNIYDIDCLVFTDTDGVVDLFTSV